MSWHMRNGVGLFVCLFTFIILSTLFLYFLVCHPYILFYITWVYYWYMYKSRYERDSHFYDALLHVLLGEVLTCLKRSSAFFISGHAGTHAGIIIGIWLVFPLCEIKSECETIFVSMDPRMHIPIPACDGSSFCNKQKHILHTQIYYPSFFLE